ncbi:MAG: signal peptidase II [Pseudomonadota bacterium]
MLALTALGVFVLDQVTKYWIVWYLDLANRFQIDVLPPYLTFKMAWNEGINFGLQIAGRWVLVGLALAISLGLSWWILGRRSVLLASAAGLVVGGAIGNAVDRVLYGAVADFLNMSCCGIDNPFAFNVADIAIFAGAVVIAFRS